MIRILQVYDNLNVASGVCSVFMNLYRNIDRSAFQFDFLTFRPGIETYEAEINELGGFVYHLTDPLSLTGIVCYRREVDDFFKKMSGRYNIIHLHSSNYAKFILPYAQKHGITHRIVHSHSSMTSPVFLKAIINKYLNSYVSKYANHFYTCSELAGLFLFGKKAVDKGEVIMINNSIAGNEFPFEPTIRSYYRKNLKFSDSDIVVAHVSNFHPIKNILFLLPIIQSTSSSVKYLFVGDGQERSLLEERVKSMGLEDRCVFVGRTRDVAQYLNAADIFLLPSIKEGLPVSVVEAEATGLSCLVSDTITRECNIGWVDFLSLEVKTWLKYIQDFIPSSDSERIKRHDLFMDSCFNIRNEIRKLENLYMSYTQRD